MKKRQKREAATLWHRELRDAAQPNALGIRWARLEKTAREDSCGATKERCAYMVSRMCPVEYKGVTGGCRRTTGAHLFRGAPILNPLSLSYLTNKYNKYTYNYIIKYYGNIHIIHISLYMALCTYKRVGARLVFDNIKKRCAYMRLHNR